VPNEIWYTLPQLKYHYELLLIVKTKPEVNYVSEPKYLMYLLYFIQLHEIVSPQPVDQNNSVDMKFSSISVFKMVYIDTSFVNIFVSYDIV